jgi:pyrroline-5-carboxylate reductase
MEKNIGIIGYGSMGKMIFSKIVGSKIIPENNVFLSNRTYEKIIDIKNIYPQINLCKYNQDVAKNADILFICVKPLEIKIVLLDIINVIKNDCHIISINGSVLFKQIEKICKNNKVSKIMPSVTAEVNQSITLVSHNENVNSNEKNTLKTLLECLGTVIEIPEMEMGMGSELTSCMPGFIGAIFKVITDEAEKHTSINKNDIVKMVIGTLYGTGKLLLEKEMTFEQLINRVQTKGGITEEGTKIIYEKIPETINKLFEKTIEKRKITTEKAQKVFDI